ncbi:MAG TPA: hypothetical protein VN716_19035 [Vicinamibacterales bacterium]|nr:hypothetical protein [Vicinamibacterales bacterium]
MSTELWIGAAIAYLVLSLFVAALASGGRGTAAWGLLGPPGWIVAALRGVHLRMDESASAAAVAAEPPRRAKFRVVSQDLDAERRTLVMCITCGTQTRATADECANYDCAWCSANAAGS